MYKQLLLLFTCCCALISHAQKIDTLVVFYKSDQYLLSKPDRQRIDTFLREGWDKITINGYTDEVDEEGYNIDLSKKRSGEVYKYCNSKNVPAAIMASQSFGETMPQADNGSDEGRALNRRTEIIGFRYARIDPTTIKIPVDPMKPVTNTLDNGFIVTYRPGTLPDYMVSNFASGSGMDFQMITNTVEMRQASMFNNTTNGEILSSVLIVCGNRMDPCKLDSPILMRIPIPMNTKCPIDKVKFFNTTAERGKRIWQEQSKELYPEVINGRKYIRIWMDNFCECINFDFKLDPDCFETDSIQLQYYVNSNPKNFTVELAGMNSVYLPKKASESVFNILYIKGELANALATFTLYNRGKRIRSFVNFPVQQFPYDEANKKYMVTTSNVQLHFPKLKMGRVLLKVSGDKYWVASNKNTYDFTYLNRNAEKISVDFSVIDKKGRVITIKDHPLDSLPFDAVNHRWVVDKEYLKRLVFKQSNTMAGL
jgi:hypothetical protein